MFLIMLLSQVFCYSLPLGPDDYYFSVLVEET
jgi:hypothetical protein